MEQMDTTTETICSDILEETEQEVEELNAFKDHADSLTNNDFKIKAKSLINEELLSIQGIRDEVLNDLERQHDGQYEFCDEGCGCATEHMTAEEILQTA